MPFNNRAGNHGGFANPGGGPANVGGAGQARPPEPLVIWTMGFENGPMTGLRFNNAGGFAAFAWTANEARFYPFTITEATTWRKMLVYNGGVVSGNVDVGVYNAALTSRLVSMGSTAQAGVSVLQEFDIADLGLVAGNTYYMALVADNGTAQFTGASAAGTPVETVSEAVFRRAASFPLPADASSAVVWNNEAPTFTPGLGLSQRTLVV